MVKKRLRRITRKIILFMIKRNSGDKSKIHRRMNKSNKKIINKTKENRVHTLR